MAIPIDDMHCNTRAIDGYGKPFNFLMGPREPGKTTAMWIKIFSSWKRNKRPWVYFTRSVVEITEAMIETIFDVNIRKFFDDPIEVKYNKGAFKDGIVDVSVNGELFFRIVALSIQLRRIKLATVKHIGGTFMDEYIIDTRTGEKYLANEAFKIKEAYTTWRREADGVLKMYFAGNPYSLFNPLFLDWGVDTRKLRKGDFYVGENFVIQWVTLDPRLRAKLLAENPLYQFDEDYSGYALEGNAKNDANIRLAPKPDNYRLRYVFRIEGRLLGVFRNQDFDDADNQYWIGQISEYGRDRTAIAFDFADLVAKTALLGNDERFILTRFKNAFRTRAIEFESESVYYFIEEIYTKL